APEKHASIALRAATLRPVSVRLENDGGGASVRIAVTRGAMIRAAPQYRLTKTLRIAHHHNKIKEKKNTGSLFSKAHLRMERNMYVLKYTTTRKIEIRTY
ncbi:MAG TPA: hypothetical protein VM943_10695, partial [Pyrinomonadaceae bacterium]|nr:hypothetical protein [Pyrinomonadaceae bacterium]